MMLAPQVPISGALASLPRGARSARATVRAMRALVNAWKVYPGIINAAQSIIYLTPTKDALSELRAIFDWVQNHVRYTADVLGVEVLSNPWLTLQRQVGDCDDMATVFATLAEAVGYPTRFVLAGYEHPGYFEHVYAQVYAVGEWIDADPTERHPLGYAPPDPVALELEF